MALSFPDLDLRRYETERAVAVGVSGGPDSMALAYLLRGWAAARGIALHILTVDHGLRAESADEAAMVAAYVAGWPNTTHHILRWEGDKPDARVAETARQARYDLIGAYCRAQAIRYVFIAHHRDDQAETFLFRLAKGSGLDGLAAMQTEQARGGITLVRPLLATAKSELMDVCRAENIPFAQDPTNQDASYARPRLRAARAALEEEGLSAERLAVTARRMARARAALESLARDAYALCLFAEQADAVALRYDALRARPEEITLRVLLNAMAHVSEPSRSYPPRLEKVEELAARYLAGKLEKTVTLGGCLFVPDRKNGLLWVRREPV